jgi:hypothetical protein
MSWTGNTIAILNTEFHTVVVRQCGEDTSASETQKKGGRWTRLPKGEGGKEEATAKMCVAALRIRICALIMKRRRRPVSSKLD